MVACQGRANTSPPDVRPVTLSAEPGFRDDLYRAKQIRSDFTSGEQILDIADNTADDWSFNNKTGKLTVNKELVLRSKIRIEARQFHMSRLHPQQWGEKQQSTSRTIGRFCLSKSAAAKPTR
jgi:hypothetical protein